MLSLSAYAIPLIERRWEDIGAPPPLHRPDTYAWVERRIRTEYPNHHPLDEPEELLKKEGFDLAYRPGYSCGSCIGEVILASIRKDPKERFLVLQHERFHAWVRRLGYEMNDTDAWLGTVALIAPPWVRANAPTLLLWSKLPPWFLLASDLIPEG